MPRDRQRRQREAGAAELWRPSTVGKRACGAAPGYRRQDEAQTDGATSRLLRRCSKQQTHRDPAVRAEGSTSLEQQHPIAAGRSPKGRSPKTAARLQAYLAPSCSNELSRRTGCHAYVQPPAARMLSLPRARWRHVTGAGMPPNTPCLLQRLVLHHHGKFGSTPQCRLGNFDSCVTAGEAVPLLAPDLVPLQPAASVAAAAAAALLGMLHCPASEPGEGCAASGRAHVVASHLQANARGFGQHGECRQSCVGCASELAVAAQRS